MPRTRTEGPTRGYVSRECQRVWEKKLYNEPLITNPPYVFHSELNSQETYLYRKMEDEVTPNFTRAMRNGDIVNNDMTSRKVIAECEPCYLNAKAHYGNASTDQYWMTWTGSVDLETYGIPSVESIHTLTGTPAAYPIVDEAALVQKAYLRAQSTPLNAWVALGEARETIETVILCFRAIQSLMAARCLRDIIPLAVKRAHRGKWSWKAIAAVYRESADAWLLVRYGLRPLFYDLMGALEAFQKVGDRARQKFTSNGDAFSWTSQGTEVTDLLYGNLRMKFQLTRTVTQESYAGLLVKPTFEDLTLPQLLGQGNLIAAAWDLVPYSFIVDWFVGIQELLASWSPDGFFHPLASWVVIKQSDVTMMVPDPEEPCVVDMIYRNLALETNTAPRADGVPMQHGVTYCAKRTESKYFRIANPAKALLPTFKLKLGAAQVVDLLALLKSFRYLLRK